MVVIEAPGESLYRKLQLLPRDRQLDVLSRMSRKQRELITSEHWSIMARPSQRAMWDEPWKIRGQVTGRGTGKSRSGGEATVEAHLDHGEFLTGIAGQTLRDTKTVMAAEVMKASRRRGYTAELHDVLEYGLSVIIDGGRWISRLFTAEEPRSFRGPNVGFMWADEIATWAGFDKEISEDHPWSTAGMMVRVGAGRTMFTTTPRYSELLLSLIDSPDTLITGGHILENAHNLTPGFVQDKLDQYGNSRLGRQELAGELLTDIAGAMWSTQLLDGTRVLPNDVPPLGLTVLAVDPASTSNTWSDYSGLAVAGSHLREAYLLYSDRVKLEPDDLANHIVSVAREYNVDYVVAEVNGVGAMLPALLGTVDSSLYVSQAHAGPGKYIRAEPVHALYEQGRVHHVGSDHRYLEAEQRAFTRTSKRKDTVDALVWAITELLLVESPPDMEPEYVTDYA